jgi:hypothetical protein
MWRVVSIPKPPNDSEVSAYLYPERFIDVQSAMDFAEVQRDDEFDAIVVQEFSF